jgi:hypothetical protein
MSMTIAPRGADAPTRRPAAVDRATSSKREADVTVLAGQLPESTIRLVRHEVELAKAELSINGKQAGVGAATLGRAGVLGLYALGAATAAAIAALSLVMSTVLAALVVALHFAAAAGVTALAEK